MMWSPQSDCIWHDNINVLHCATVYAARSPKKRVLYGADAVGIVTTEPCALSYNKQRVPAAQGIVKRTIVQLLLELGYAGEQEGLQASRTHIRIYSRSVLPNVCKIGSGVALPYIAPLTVNTSFRPSVVRFDQVCTSTRTQEVLHVENTELLAKVAAYPGLFHPHCGESSSLLLKQDQRTNIS